MESKKFFLNEHNGDFHLIKDGNKRATRVFSDKKEALSYIKQHNLMIFEPKNLEENCEEALNLQTDNEDLSIKKTMVLEYSLKPSDPIHEKKNGPNLWQKIISWFSDL